MLQECEDIYQLEQYVQNYHIFEQGLLFPRQTSFPTDLEETQIEKIWEILRCGLCGSKLKDAKLLLCSHRFCSQCLVNYFKDRTEVKVCPTCSLICQKHPRRDPEISKIIQTLSKHSVSLKVKQEEDTEDQAKEQMAAQLKRSCDETNQDVSNSSVSLKKFKPNPSCQPPHSSVSCCILELKPVEYSLLTPFLDFSQVLIPQNAPLSVLCSFVAHCLNSSPANISLFLNPKDRKLANLSIPVCAHLKPKYQSLSCSDGFTDLDETVFTISEIAATIYYEVNI